MEVEVRISSDGNSVAIRSEHAEDAWNAWGVMNRQNGGHWAKTSKVTEGWLKVTATEPVPAPEPEPPVE